MFKIPNWDLFELESDLLVLKDHLDFVEEQMRAQSEKSERELDSKLADYDYSDEYERAMHYQEIQVHQNWVAEGLPRLVINPFVVSLWSFYELVLVELAGLVQEKKSSSLSLSDIKGKHMLARAEKYFNHVLAFPIDFTVDQRTRLNWLGVIRNAIVHSNGRMTGLTRRHQQALRESKVEGAGLSGNGNHVVLEVGYAKRTFEVVQEHVRLLFQRYEAL